jgi:hypothetical protein
VRPLAVAFALAIIAAGCSGSKTSVVAISPELPPSPKTWPAYPKFSPHSCWARPTTSPEITQVAPSTPVTERNRPTLPREIVRRLLARLGDRSIIRGIEVSAPPASAKVRHIFPGKKPPADALWAYIDAPKASLDAQSAHVSAAEMRTYALVEWETELVGGALRDDFCRAGGRALVGWTTSRKVINGGVSDGTFAINQRFPNPSRREFRARVDLVGRRYGFRATSVRFLRPREVAPIVIVDTDRDPRKFIADVPAIMDLLDPKSISGHRGALTFEGFFLEANGADGPFVRVFNSWRGKVMGGQWSAYRDAYPYPHG